MMTRITSPSEHRAILLMTMEGILEGKVSVPMANAIASVSSEVHRSLRQEWDMRVYAAENLSLDKGRVTKMLDVNNG